MSVCLLGAHVAEMRALKLGHPETISPRALPTILAFSIIDNEGS